MIPFAFGVLSTAAAIFVYDCVTAGMHEYERLTRKWAK